MPTRAYYVQKAKIAFDMAAVSSEKDRQARWIERANEYLILADALGDDPPPATSPGPSQPAQEQQPVAQQQQQIQSDKSEPEKD